MRRAWRGGAPRTSHALSHFISAFTLSYVALLDSLFTLFLFLPLLRHTYVILTLSTKLLSPPRHTHTLIFFPLLFLAPFHPDRLIFLFQPSLLSRIFTLPHFPAITFRDAALFPQPLCSLPPQFRGCKRFPRIPSRLVVHSRLSVY